LVGSGHGSRLKEFHWITVRIVKENLLAARANDNFISKAHADLLEFGNAGWQVSDFEHKPIPPTGFWTPPIGHRTSVRTLGASEPKGEITQ